MNANNFNKDMFIKLAHSPVTNYVVPGLTSYLIGSPSEHGCVRMFHSEREHQECLTPHSHRFDLQSWVIQGSVTNIIWTPTTDEDPNADLYKTTVLNYKGDIGQYTPSEGGVNKWKAFAKRYSEGDCYQMNAEEVHSIRFSRGAIVVIFEGAQVSDSSIIIQPYVNDKLVPTFKVEDWMFLKGKNDI
jgi:hypothetical protein